MSCSGAAETRGCGPTSLSRSGRPAEAGSGAKRLPAWLDGGPRRGRRLRCLDRGRRRNALRLGSTPRPPALMIASKLSRSNGSVPDAASAPNRQAEITLLLLVGQHLHVEGDDALGRDAGRLHRPRSDRRWRRRASLFGDGVEAVGRGDQRRAVGRDQAAQDGAARPPSVRPRARCRLRPAPASATASARGRLSAAASRHNRSCAGALRDAGHRGRLRVPALRFGQLDDPVGEHAAALAAHGEDGDADRPLGRVSVSAFATDRS